MKDYREIRSDYEDFLVNQWEESLDDDLYDNLYNEVQEMLEKLDDMQKQFELKVANATKINEERKADGR